MSATLIDRAKPETYATSRHCLTEFYNASTRRFAVDAEPLTPDAARGAIDVYVDILEVLETSAHQQIEAIRRFAELGGVGARVYDYLIGQVAVVHTIPLIVTWNVKHFTLLFPMLRIATPQTILEEA